MLPSADDHSIPSLRKCTLALDTLSRIACDLLQLPSSQSEHILWASSIFLYTLWTMSCAPFQLSQIPFGVCLASHFNLPDTSWSMSCEEHGGDGKIADWVITISDASIKQLPSSVAKHIHKTQLPLIQSNHTSQLQTHSNKSPAFRTIIMRLSIIISALIASLAVAAPAPESDSPELVKRYCGDNPPTHPACPKGRFVVSEDAFHASSWKQPFLQFAKDISMVAVLW